jgi:DNA (cytosine-5)-methyltransferase 1
MTFADLFAGIGGFRLGLERAGHECKWACEIDGFCRKVYLKHWPDTDPFYKDIRDVTNPPHVDLLCGGPPCQPFSIAGRKTGPKDRRNLWPEMLRLVEIVRPVWVVGENVPNIADYANDIIASLESAGYEPLPIEIPADALGAHFEGNRIWIIAKSTATSSVRQQGERPSTLGADQWSGDEFERLVRLETEHGIPAGSFGRVSDGVSHRAHRLRALGNAVVPQVVEWIGRRIAECEKGLTSPP